MSEKKPEAGEWWRRVVSQDIVFICGHDPEGDPVYSEYGGITVDCDLMSEFLDNHEHLPNCTGFDWEPPKPKPKTRTVTLTTYLMWDSEGTEFVTEQSKDPRGYAHVKVLGIRTVEVPCE